MAEMLFLRAGLCWTGRAGWMVWRRGGRKTTRKRRRTPWSAAWGSSERLEVGGGKEGPAEIMVKRSHPRSFRAWEHRRELVGLL